MYLIISIRILRLFYLLEDWKKIKNEWRFEKSRKSSEDIPSLSLITLYKSELFDQIIIMHVMIGTQIIGVEASARKWEVYTSYHGCKQSFKLSKPPDRRGTVNLKRFKKLSLGIKALLSYFPSASMGLLASASILCMELFILHSCLK